MSDIPWETKITKIRENEIRIHGYAIEDLMGNRSFAETAFLLFTGRLPEDNEGRLFNTMMVACVDHGVTPPSTLAALTAASTGAPMNGALAAGILSINEFHGGAIGNSMKMLIDLEKLSEKEYSGQSRAAAASLIETYSSNGQRLPGFGHRIHKDDPRTAKLFSEGKRLKVSGKYIELIEMLTSVLEEVRGMKLPVNVDGAIGALLLDLGIHREYANAFFIMSRMPGLIAHVFEEQTMQKKMRRIDPVNHIYTGTRIP